MNLPKLSGSNVKGKKVLVRLDLDVGSDTSRVESAKETLEFLVGNSAKTIIIGHKGRPDGVEDELSLRPLAKVIGGVVGKEVGFVENATIEEGEIVLLENLRFDSREENNDENFAKELASLGQFFVNEAFAVSHRPHTSIVGVPKYLPHAAGFRFTQEVENLNKILVNPKRPLVIIISGVKEDKVEMAKALTNLADKVLVGGRLPVYFGDVSPNPEKLVIGDLTFDGFDITLNTAVGFKKIISEAGTIIMAGVLGKYEDEGHRQGTKEVFEAVAACNAYKIAGGGDTEAALSLFGLTEKFDWISVGGGAMLEFLIKGTLPGIAALLE